MANEGLPTTSDSDRLAGGQSEDVTAENGELHASSSVRISKMNASMRNGRSHWAVWGQLLLMFLIDFSPGAVWVDATPIFMPVVRRGTLI